MKRLGVPLLALLLGACSVAPPIAREGVTLSLAQWQPPAVPTQWSLTGRAAVAVPQRSGTLSLFWHQRGQDYRIDLRAPLGAGAMRLSRTGAGVTLRTGGGDVYRAASARALLREGTGYDLPIEYLQWWVRGLPAPNLEGTVTVDGAGHPALIEQAGWTIRYGSFEPAGDYALPQRLSVERDDIRLRLAVSAWELDG